MASAEQILRSLGDGSWEDHIRELRAQHGKQTAKFIASQVGVTADTARRWMSKAGILRSRKSAPNVANQNRIRNVIAAARLTGKTFYPGRVEVSSSTRPKDGNRRAVERITGGIDGSAFGDAASYVARGDYAGAGAAFDFVVMDRYGGLGGSLFDCDYEGYRIQ